MAVISKKTALIWVLIIAGAVTLWKFVWKPMEGKEAAAPASGSAMAQKESTGAMVAERPSTGGMMGTVEKKSVTVRTSYKNPAGSDEVGFTLTVDAAGVIVDAAAEVLATHDISKMRQTAFAAGLPEAIKGKKLSELSSIDRVGGSSLTTGAFNAALPQLQAQL